MTTFHEDDAVVQAAREAVARAYEAEGAMSAARDARNGHAVACAVIRWAEVGYRAALAAMPAGEVVVKPLEWDSVSQAGVHIAHTKSGRYLAYADGTAYGPDGQISFVACREWSETEAVCQNDYETRIRSALATTQPRASGEVTFQARVAPWMQACFGSEISNDRLERGDRFLEEAIELLQSGDYPRERITALVDYVYDRPQGEINQEVGGVMVTLAAYCLAYGLDMHAAGETELARIWTKVETIRAKQAAKPTGSALPIALAAPPAPADAVPTIGVDLATGPDRTVWHDPETGISVSEDNPNWPPAFLSAEAALRAVQGWQPTYPKGDVVGPCVCGSWPGGPCFRCEWAPAAPAVGGDDAGA